MKALLPQEGKPVVWAGEDCNAGDEPPSYSGDCGMALE
jgi:hypothetical protein